MHEAQKKKLPRSMHTLNKTRTKNVDVFCLSTSSVTLFSIALHSCELSFQDDKSNIGRQPYIINVLTIYI
jgi:hypothetical protein